MVKTVATLKTILGKNRLNDLGFDMSTWPICKQARTLNVREQELPFTTNIGKVNGIELQEIMEKVVTSMENLIVQLEGESSKDLSMHQLLGLDKQLRSIRGSLKVDTVKKG